MESLQRLDVFLYSKGLLQKKVLVRGGIGFAALLALYKALKLWKKQQSRRPLPAVQPSSAPALAPNASSSRNREDASSNKLSIKKILSKKVVRDQLINLALVAIFRTFVNDRIASLQGIIFKLLFLKDVPAFWRYLVEDIVFSIGQSYLESIVDFMTRNLALSCRELVVKHLDKLYFTGMSYYHVNFVDKRIDNPEQIITSDVPRMCDSIAEISSDLIKGVFESLFFTYRLAQETNPLWSSVGWIYISTAVVIIRSISPAFGDLQATKQRLEGLLRSFLAKVATHSEAIASLGGQQREYDLAMERFGAFHSHVQKLITTHWWFGIIEDFIAKYCGSTVAMVVILGPFFSHGRGQGSVAQTSAVRLSAMRYVVSIIIHQWSAIGTMALCVRKGLRLAAFQGRVTKLVRVLADLHSHSAQHAHANIREGKEIAFDNVEIFTPSNVCLVKDLSFHIKPGVNLLITGPNGAGKSSIFRCLGGLWAVTRGTITRPNSLAEGLCSDVFYLPQKPYNAIGSLRDQLTYPATGGHDGLTDVHLKELLSLVELDHLLARSSDSNVNWEESLSLGETQRLAIARLLYHNPTFAILDECTSGVSTAMEERLYLLCRARNITCITISHRPALTAFHDIKLQLDGNGGYSIEELPKVDLPASLSLLRPHDAMPSTSSSLPPASSASLPHSSTSESKPSSYDAMPPLSSLTNSSSRKRFLKILRLFVPSFFSSASLKLGLLAGVVVGRVFLSDRIAHLNGDTVKYLLQSDLQGFKRLVVVSLGQCLAQAVLAPSLHYLTRLLSQQWHQALFRRLLSLYFTSNGFYVLNNTDRSVTDASQILSVEVDELCSVVAHLFPDVIKPIADIIWFSSQCVMFLGIKNTALLYSFLIAGLGGLRLVAPNFAALSSKKRELESHYRHSHDRLKMYAESVAIFGGDEREGGAIRTHFHKLMAHLHKHSEIDRDYELMEDFVTKRFVTIITWALSLMYINMQGGDVYSDAGGRLGHDLRFVASAISHTFLAFGELLSLYKRVSELSGYVHRVAGLWEVLEANAHTQSLASKLVENETLSFEHVDIVTPLGHTLVRDVSFGVPRGSNLLVTGPNTSGKSSLFRVLGGLWAIRKGSILRPLRPTGASSQHTSVSSTHAQKRVDAMAAMVDSVFFVPQRPYHVSGTLADQLTYPVKANLSDPVLTKRILDVLEMVGLAYLADRQGGLAGIAEWANVLSLGEQQRIGMGRLFYHKPLYAVLDQCTDAVSVDVEEALYDRARALGITIITISQRPGLVGHHAENLRLLDGQGGWELVQLSH